MDEGTYKKRNESMGTNYTFRDKHGNLIVASDRGLDTEGDHENEKTTDAPGLHHENSKF